MWQCIRMKDRGYTCRRKAVGTALGDLSSLSAALGTAAKEAASLKPQRGLGCGGAKARRRITTQETIRLQQVGRLLPTKSIDVRVSMPQVLAVLLLGD